MNTSVLRSTSSAEWDKLTTHSWVDHWRETATWDETLGNKRDVITWSSITHPTEYASITLKSPVAEDGEPIYWTPSDNETTISVSVGSVEHDYIRKVFKEIDKLIEPTFIETSPQEADILMLALKGDNENGWMTTQTAYPITTQGQLIERGPKLGTAAYVEATGKEYLDDWEMDTIVHEIGHVLGLAHPYDKELGDDPEFDMGMTAMSYNIIPEFPHHQNVFFRELDIHTLQEIWGVETNPEPAEWPATEKVPSIVDHLPYTSPKVNFSDLTASATSAVAEAVTAVAETEAVVAETEASIFIEEANSAENNARQPTPMSSDDVEELNTLKIEKGYFKLAKKITDKPWGKYVKRKIGFDSEMTIHINYDASIVNHNKLKKLGKHVPLSTPELEFALSILNDIDKACGLDFELLPNEKGADLILSPMKMKKWDYYMLPGSKKKSMHGAWFNNGDGILDVSEKNLFTQVLLEMIGLKGLPDSKKNHYTTFDTIMSWDDEKYYGFTKADKIALENMWGSESLG